MDALFMPRDFPVSVIVPTFNRRDLLPRALDSVLSQTFEAREIIVVDDGSTDGTISLLKEKYPSVKALHQENQGVSAARNRGIAEAKSEWLAFLDSDDEWLPRKLEKQGRALLENRKYEICHGNDIWVRNNRRVNPPRKYAKGGGRIFQKCLPACVISPSAAVIRRDLFGAVGAFDETLPAAEDYDLWLRICAEYPVLYLDDPLIIKYDGHPGQLSHQWGIDRYRIKALRKILDSGKLGGEDFNAARRALSEKCHIYALGARKRGKDKEAAEYEKIPGRYGL